VIKKVENDIAQLKSSETSLFILIKTCLL